MKKPLVWLGMGIVAAAMLLAWCAEGIDKAKDRPSTAVSDSLTKRNEYLATKYKILLAKNAVLTVERDKFQRQRDSLLAVSDSATRELRRRRTTLPAAPPDSTIRIAYAEALQVLDSTLAELAIKDEIIRLGKEAERKAKEAEANFLLQIANLTEERDNEHQIAAQWLKNYWDLYAQKNPRCGQKCSLVVGGLFVVGVAIAANQVQGALGR